MTLQLFYPLSKEQQFTDDVRVTRGIAFTTKLPDGSLCYSIRTSDKMAENLTIKPCTDWTRLHEYNDSPFKDCTNIAQIDLSAARFSLVDTFRNCKTEPISSPTLLVNPDAFKNL